jgi:hypothetical protein
MPEFEIDDVLAGSEEFARTALLEITEKETIGALVAIKPEADGVVTFLFESTQAGYPGWTWASTIAHVPDSEPTLVEAELIPGENALLAPAWVPWAERLAEYRSTQAANAEGVVELDGELVDGELLVDELDDDEDADDAADDDDEDDDDDESDEFVSSGVDHQLEEIVDNFDEIDIDDADDDESDESDESDVSVSAQGEVEQAE